MLSHASHIFTTDQPAVAQKAILEFLQERRVQHGVGV